MRLPSFGPRVLVCPRSFHHVSFSSLFTFRFTFTFTFTLPHVHVPRSARTGSGTPVTRSFRSTFTFLDSRSRLHSRSSGMFVFLDLFAFYTLLGSVHLSGSTGFLTRWFWFIARSSFDFLTLLICSFVRFVYVRSRLRSLYRSFYTRSCHVSITRLHVTFAFGFHTWILHTCPHTRSLVHVTRSGCSSYVSSFAICSFSFLVYV